MWMVLTLGTREFLFKGRAGGAVLLSGDCLQGMKLGLNLSLYRTLSKAVKLLISTN